MAYFWILLDQNGPEGQGQLKVKTLFDIKSKKSISWRFALVVATGIFTLLLAGPPLALRTRDLVPISTMLIAGVVLFTAGLVLSIWARATLDRNWDIPMAHRRGNKLVTSGPYRLVRHPIYTGYLLMALGSAVDDDSSWLALLIIAGAFFIYSAAVEERTMAKQFPKTYPAYRRQTKMLLPFIL